MDEDLGFDDPHRLIRGLLSPTAYAHPVDAVPVIETHISWVFLTGTYAYKVKKPVNLGFLDFSTLEQREYYCHEEVRLNRRLAAEFYLGVVPITGTADSPQVGGSGQPIEFAVQMRQFPQQALLTNVLERGELTAEQIDRLTDEIADFHRSVAVAPPESRFGQPEMLWKPMQENFDQLDTSGGTTGSLQAETLKNWSLSEFLRLRDDFTARKSGGFVRECHGDMHLGNMFLDDAGRIVIFDCIEFNESFRWIDVLSEAAFAVMDLEDRGRPDFARRLLNGYLERNGDYTGLSVFRYYLVYRALVRAKVACIRSRQGDVTTQQRERLGRELHCYFDLAESYTAPPPPLLMITHGPSGSGKTTLTQPLLEQFGAIRIRSDIERKRLFGLHPLNRPAAGLDIGIYSPAAGEQTYTRLAELAAAVVEARYSVIVDAAFLKQTQREQFRRIADRLGVPFVILDFQASPETMRERIRARLRQARDASDADLAVLEHQLAAREALDQDEAAAAIRIESEKPESLKTALQILQTKQRACAGLTRIRV